MPRGHDITERDRNRVLDMNAELDQDDKPILTLRQIAERCNVSERSAAMIVRVYAAKMRRLQRQCAEIDSICNRMA